MYSATLQFFILQTKKASGEGWDSNETNEIGNVINQTHKLLLHIPKV